MVELTKTCAFERGNCWENLDIF